MFSIKGYILYREQLLQGYINVNDERIDSVTQEPIYNVEYDFQDMIIMPAAIDTNVQFIWNDFESSSNQALLGGVSVIVCGPQSSPQDLHTDFIVSNFSDNYQPDVKCYHTYLQPQLQRDAQEIPRDLPENTCHFIHVQSSIDKDLQITSPFRQNLHERLGFLDFVDADGINAELGSDVEDDGYNDPELQKQLEYLHQVNSPIKEISNFDEQTQKIKCEMTQEPTTPNISTKVFKKQSKEHTEQSQLSLISRAELFSYDNVTPVEPEYKFPEEPPQQQQQQQQQEEESSPSSNKPTLSPQMSIQSSDTSSPDSLNIKSNYRLRTRSNTNSLLQRRQSKQGFQIQLHQVETSKKKGSGDHLITNYSESRARQMITPKFNKDYLCFLAFRPISWELQAINKIKRVIKEQKSKIVLKGFSSALALIEIKELLSDQVYSDLSYPHLLIDSDQIKEGQTIFKSDPPIRQKLNKHLLQKAINQGWISSVSSQHLNVSSLYKFENNGDFRRAFGGLCCIGCTFPALWTVLFCKKNFDISYVQSALNKQDDPHLIRFVRKLIMMQQYLSYNPSKYLGLQDRGLIEQGFVADIVVFNPFSAQKFKANEQFEDKHVLQNKLLLGTVEHMFIRGKLIVQNQKVLYQRKGLKI